MPGPAPTRQGSTSLRSLSNEVQIRSWSKFRRTFSMECISMECIGVRAKNLHTGVENRPRNFA
jgi:hypothetical protein